MRQFYSFASKIRGIQHSCQAFNEGFTDHSTWPILGPVVEAEPMQSDFLQIMMGSTLDNPRMSNWAWSIVILKSLIVRSRNSRSGELGIVVPYYDDTIQRRLPCSSLISNTASAADTLYLSAFTDGSQWRNMLLERFFPVELFHIRFLQSWLSLF